MFKTTGMTVHSFRCDFRTYKPSYVRYDVCHSLPAHNFVLRVRITSQSPAYKDVAISPPIWSLCGTPLWKNLKVAKKDKKLTERRTGVSLINKSTLRQTDKNATTYLKNKGTSDKSLQSKTTLTDNTTFLKKRSM